MNYFDKSAHGANVLVSIAGCILAADTVSSGGAFMSGFMSVKAMFTGNVRPPAAIYARTKAALDTALEQAHLTPDDRDKVHYAINAGCPENERIIALGRDARKIAEDMALALDNTDASQTLKDTFVRIVAEVLDVALKDPDSATELASAFQDAMVAFRQQSLANDEQLLANDAKQEALLQEILRRFDNGLPGAVAQADELPLDDLQTLAAAFGEDKLETRETLTKFLTQKAEEYRNYKTLIDGLDERIAAVANLKGAAQDAAERLDFDVVENLLSRVDQVETEIAVNTKEARASNALLRNRPEEAYRIFTSAAEALAGVDEIAAAYRRDRYRSQLYNHGLRYGGTGLALAADMIRPAIAALENTAHRQDWAAYTQNLATALANQGIRTAGPAGNDLLAQAVTAFRDALTVRTKADHPVDWAGTQQNLAIALETQGSRTAGPAGNDLLAQAVAAYRDALTVRTKADHPVDWARTQQNLAGALQTQGSRTAGPAGDELLAQAVTAFRDALTVRTKADHPVQWAMTQQNLAGALQTQGSRTAGPAGNDLLAQAVTAFRDALTVRTKADHPVDWAETTQNLAGALATQGARTDGAKGLDLLAEAVAAYEAALTMRTEADHPAQWAQTQENLAMTQRQIAQHPATADPAPHWDAALAHVDAALTVHDDSMSFYHDKATALRDAILARR